MGSQAEPRLHLPCERDEKLAAKLKAFVYQADALEAIKNLEYSAVFHEPGLGKTKIGVDLILYWLSKDVVDSAIVVTKRGLIENWRAEVSAHSFLQPRVLDQNRRANFYAFNSPTRVYLTHYEVFRKEEKRLALFLKTRRVGIILDEAHKIKNPDSAITTVFLGLRSGFKRRVIMTGTPVANRPYDVWAPIYFLDSGASLGTDFNQFRRDLDLSNDLAFDPHRVEAFQDNLAGVFGRVSSFAVRATKVSAGIVLPQKEIRNVPAVLEDRQREIYERFKKENAAIVVKEGVPHLDKADELLKRLMRLVEVASNPSLVDESYKRQPGKFAILQGIVDRVVDAGEKVIVWTSFTENVRWLSRELECFGTAMVSGKLSYEERSSSLKRFKEHADTRILIATPGSAKEGLTLTVANHAVFYDRSFSLDDYLQAQDRIHRISQTRKCYVYNLIAQDSIDEWVDVLLTAKRLAAMLAQGDITREQYEAEATYEFGRIIREVLGLEEQ